MYSQGYTQIHDFIVFLSEPLRDSMRALLESSHNFDEKQTFNFVSTQSV